MTEMICAPLSYLRGGHPEVPASNFEIALRNVRRGIHNLVITDQGETLGFAVHELPESILNSDIDLTPYAFNKALLKPSWFRSFSGVRQCTRHGRFLCWMVSPRFAHHVVPVLEVGL